MIVVKPHLATLEYTNVPENDHAEYVAGTTYALGERVIVLANKKIYESLQDANTGNTPSTSPEWWLDLGAMNAHKMFDEFVNTKTVNADSIHVKLAVGKVDYIAFFGLVGSDIELTLWDATETTKLWEDAFNLTYGLSTVSSASWYEYFFGEYEVKEDFSTLIGVVAFNAILEIKILNPGVNAECAKVVVGRRHRIGLTQYGVGVGIVDYSRNMVDDFGRRYMRQGNFSKRNDVTLWIENTQVDPVYRLLASLRGTSTAWVTDSRDEETGRFESLIVYGFYRDFNIVIKHPTISECRLEIEGMI